MASQTELNILIKLKDEASKGLGLLSSGFKAVGVGALALGGAIGGIAVAAIKEFSDAQKGVAQLDAVLKSTHGAAGLFKQDILDQASALQRMTTYTDEAVLGAQNLLLTFTNVKGPIFQDSIATILDMSTALGQDLKSSAVQVGKALNDPIQGITALSRVGVNFTDTQKAMIEKLVLSGKTMDAQKVILKELATEFGGSAAKQAETFSGKLQQMKNAGSDLLEVIGEPLVAALTPVISKFVEFAQSVTVQEKLQQLVEVIKNLIYFLTEQVPQAITAAVNSIKAWVNDMIATFQALWANISQNELIIGFVEMLRKAFEALWGTIKYDLWPQLQSLWDTIQNQLWPALQNLFRALEPLMPLFEMWLKVIGALIGAGLVILITALTGMLIVITKILQAIIALVDYIVQKFTGVLISITGDVMKVVDAFKSLFDWIGKVSDKFNQWKGSGASLNPFSESFKLPFLAEGGIVTRPTLAMIGEGGEPEAVIPFSKLGALGGPSIGITITGNYIGSNMDVRNIAEEISTYLTDKLNLNQRVNV